MTLPPTAASDNNKPLMWTVPFGNIHGWNISTLPYSLTGTLPCHRNSHTELQVNNNCLMVLLTWQPAWASTRNDQTFSPYHQHCLVLPGGLKKEMITHINHTVCPTPLISLLTYSEPKRLPFLSYLFFNKIIFLSLFYYMAKSITAM